MHEENRKNRERIHECSDEGQRRILQRLEEKDNLLMVLWL